MTTPLVEQTMRTTDAYTAAQAEQDAASKEFQEDRLRYFFSICAIVEYAIRRTI